MKNSPRGGVSPPAKQKTARTVPGPQRLSSTDAGFRHRPGTERTLPAEGGAAETGAQAPVDPAKAPADPAKAKPKTSPDKLKSARTAGPKTSSAAASSKMIESTLKQLEEAQKQIAEMKETFVCEAVRTEFTTLQQMVAQKEAAEEAAAREIEELKAEVEQLKIGRDAALQEVKALGESSSATVAKLKEEKDELEKRATTAERTTQVRYQPTQFSAPQPEHGTSAVTSTPVVPW